MSQDNAYTKGVPYSLYSAPGPIYTVNHPSVATGNLQPPVFNPAVFQAPRVIPSPFVVPVQYTPAAAAAPSATIPAVYPTHVVPPPPAQKPKEPLNTWSKTKTYEIPMDLKNLNTWSHTKVKTYTIPAAETKPAAPPIPNVIYPSISFGNYVGGHCPRCAKEPAWVWDPNVGRYSYVHPLK
ncbi:hypothetical protein RUND412_005491 [Rhizina undulata]